MNKSQLKDGMILRFKNGTEGLYLCENLFLMDSKISKGVRGSDIRMFPMELLDNNLKPMSYILDGYEVEEIVYEKKVIWTRNRLYTLDQAIRSGKPFKHITMVNHHTNISDVVKELHKTKSHSYILSILTRQEKEWLIF